MDFKTVQKLEKLMTKMTDEDIYVAIEVLQEELEHRSQEYMKETVND